MALSNKGERTNYGISDDSGISSGTPNNNDEPRLKTEKPVSQYASAAVFSATKHNKIAPDTKIPGPQGFKAGQLRKRGYLTCLRNCGATFASKGEEEAHYRRGGEACTNFMILENAPEPVDLAKIRSGPSVFDMDRSLKVAQKLIEEIKRN